MTGDGAVGRFGLHALPVGSDQHRGHQSERSEALGHRIALDVAVIVLAGPNECPFPLKRGGYHVIDEPVLVGDTGFPEKVTEFCREHLLEDLLEAAVVLFQNGVFRGEVERPLFYQRLVHAGPGKTADRLVGVVHGQGHPVAGEIIDLPGDGVTPFRSEGNGELSLSFGHKIGGLVLVAEGMPADADGMFPPRHQPRNILDEDGLPENGSVKDVADGPVGRLPHLLQSELLHPRLIGSDGGALNPYSVLQNSMGGIHGHLVSGGIAVLYAQIKIFQVDVKVGEDQFLFDELPDNARHFVAV